MMLVIVLALALALAPSATSLALELDSPALCWPALPVRLLLSAEVVNPSCEMTFEGEGADIEATVSFTILDHVPDLMRPLWMLRRYVGHHASRAPTTRMEDRGP